MSPNFQIRRVTAADAIGLGRFFAQIAGDAEASRFFHPHPFTQDTATYLAWHSQGKRDRYFVAEHRGNVVGYSMLRGWDEGYEIPSWGGCVLPALRDAGIGKCLLLHGIREARGVGAAQLRLTVYKENVRAVYVYRKIGFAFKEKNEHEWIGMLDLSNLRDLPDAKPNLEKLASWLKQGAADRQAA